MLSRTYDVLMPSDGTTAVEIKVENFTPGSAPAPVAAGSDGFYMEWRNRPLRVPIKAGSATTPATGFVPRFRLGFSLSIIPISATPVTALPSVQCSRSLVGDVFSTVSGTTTPGDGTYQDPSGSPAIKINNLNDATVKGKLFRVSLLVMDRFEDNEPGVQ